MYAGNEIQVCYGKNSVQQDERSFGQQNELKFKEEI
jgi:hypothetical protein